ncbi:hypothetical protein BDP81DRAFT_455548 [Colletotrichum phormii]|uniref:Uncharacterized protein n=1 Tax=Colletotrichum phormii TaxID=359342 RepID=A0AAI9ZCS8_9PEZI|nr:uncharacterized protein BDP81DRAFT_455548 [Colletotrichum phormii]KAK1622144.1 hypothetical protein BDP81DRAFT_455548 [Colletotrichum phormii]
MVNWGTLILAAMVAGSVAKDCAFFYDSTVSDPFMASIPASNAQWYCKNDIGGTMEDKSCWYPYHREVGAAFVEELGVRLRTTTSLIRLATTQRDAGIMLPASAQRTRSQSRRINGLENT